MLLDKGFAERCAEHTVRLPRPDGKWYTGQATIRLKAGMAERLMNVDETNMSGQSTSTKRKRFPSSKKAPAFKRYKDDDRFHVTLNAGMTMPDWQYPGGPANPTLAQALDCQVSAPHARSSSMQSRNGKSHCRCLYLRVKVITSTKAANPETVKPPPELVAASPPGTFFSATPSGSACKRTLEQWIQHNIRDRFKDELKDEDGKRVVLKIGGGPALPLDPDWLEARAREGIIIFPGLPNGSGVNQVCHALRGDGNW